MSLDDFEYQISHLKSDIQARKEATAKKLDLQDKIRFLREQLNR